MKISRQGDVPESPAAQEKPAAAERKRQTVAEAWPKQAAPAPAQMGQTVEQAWPKAPAEPTRQPAAPAQAPAAAGRAAAPARSSAAGAKAPAKAAPSAAKAPSKAASPAAKAAPAKPAAQPKPKPKPRPKARQEEEDDDEEYGRPRWHLPLGCLIVVLFGALIAFGANKGLQYYSELDGASTLGDETEFYVEQGATATDIAAALKQAQLIEYDWLFRVYAQYSGKGSSLQYGAHPLRKGMSYNDILEELSRQVEHRQTIRVTFPEGSTAVAIAQLMEDNGLCGMQEFLDCANGVDGSDFSQYAFWTQIPDTPGRLMKCEGYLFPNTYEFYLDDTVYNYVDTFYNEFDRQTADLMEEVTARGVTLDDVVILASFIQEEAGFIDEGALLMNQRVSACFHNRLESDDPLWSSHMLESNACSYIMNDGDNNYLWNSPMASYMGWRDMGYIPDEVLAAYDTYQVSGLPAGPISNPGRVAIEASLEPDPEYMAEGNKYYFFVTGHPDTDVAGEYFFAKTADEHVANVERAGWAP